MLTKARNGAAYARRRRTADDDAQSVGRRRVVPAGRPLRTSAAARTAIAVVAAALAATVVTGMAAAQAAVPVSHKPVGAIELIKGGRNGVHVTGWALDTDTTSASTIRISLDGKPAATVTANRPDPAATAAYPRISGGHGFAGLVPTTGGLHTLCVKVVDIAPAHAALLTPTSFGCRTITVLVDPVGIMQVAARQPAQTNIVVSGWAIDPETWSQIYVGISVDSKAPVRVQANLNRIGLDAGFPGIGPHHGYSAVIPVSTLAHTVCVTAYNQRQGKNTSLGCVSLPAVAASIPGMVLAVKATALITAAQVSWAVPANTGGVPVSTYRITTLPATVPATAAIVVVGSRTTATILGLRAGSIYRFVVQATNVLGVSPASVPSAAVTIQAPVAQPSGPPLISTSRYIRNLYASDPVGNRSKTFTMGATDASYNPANHAYLILLQFGGQSSIGNTQSATSNSSLTYAQTVAAMQGYLDGYASRQQANAPVTIAIGTNNDQTVSGTTGQLWAQKVVNPLATYALTHRSMSIAGANDIEPGFLGTMSQSQAWVKGFLGATTAKFVFNGSADGCGWSRALTACNNGYTAAGVQAMAGGYAPARILALPQIYNYTQPQQWKYISLTGAVTGLQKVNFAGALTEVTACLQARSCSSLTNNAAWTALSADLASDIRVKQAVLPFGTDLRIN